MLNKLSFPLIVLTTTLLVFTQIGANSIKVLNLGKVTIKYDQIRKPPDEPGVTKYLLLGKVVLVAEDTDENGKADTWFRYNIDETADLLMSDTNGNGTPDEYDAIDDNANLENVTDTYADAKILYFGAAFTRHQGEGIRVLGVVDDKPAQQAGLRKDDIILQVENISFRSQGSQPERFSSMAQDLPAGKPLRFFIKRAGKTFDIWIKPLLLDKEEHAALVKQVQVEFSGFFSKGKQAFAHDKYRQAIEYFQKSIDEYPLEAHRYIGICYMYLKEFKVALKYIVKAYKMNKKSAESTFYLANCCDNLGKIVDAKYYYKRYLKKKHLNSEMNSFAKKRLEVLKRKGKKRRSIQWLKVFDAILKETKGEN
jgi:tetratricopeptide (TPR) repeat protein